MPFSGSLRKAFFEVSNIRLMGFGEVRLGVSLGLIAGEHQFRLGHPFHIWDIELMSIFQIIFVLSN
jgi:hypothetical protein